MKVGDRVIYLEGSDPKTKEPRKFNALVLGERVVADHLGADDEPLLTLVFAKERIDSFGNPLPLHGTGQQSELVQYRVDVAHVSHEYDEDQQKKYNRTAYDGGRWYEVEDDHYSVALQRERVQANEDINRRDEQIDKHTATIADRDKEIAALRGELAKKDQV